VARDVSVPSFAQVLSGSSERPREWSALILGAVLIAVGVLAMERALLLTFNSRYIDFAFAPLTAAIAPFLVLALLRPSAGMRGTAEIVMASVLGICAIYIAVNESIANWQALWCCAALLALAVTLLRPRAAPG
jgi:glucan 1,3-beta-glucosidase